MATKGWFLGCGVVAAVAVALLLLGVGYVATRASNVSHEIESARERYAQVNRDFPFKPPPSGELNAERFVSYVKVRAALDSAVAPLRNSSGPLQGLSVLLNLPAEASGKHAGMLHDQSMSLDEYRWISRQLYTTVAAEQNRADPDPAIRNLNSILNSASGPRGGIRNRRDSDDTFNPTLLDYTWLRVPEATRAIVREHAAELAKTPNATMADNFLLNMNF